MNERAAQIHSCLEAVRERIAAACERAGRPASDVTLIGVSKTFPATDVEAALRDGQLDFGENRVQEGLAKAAQLSDRAISPRWHLIGHLQRNKVKDAVAGFGYIHSVDSERLLDAIANASTPKRPAHVFLQVNLDGREGQSGIAPPGLPGLVERARATPGVILHGLMAIGPHTDDKEDVRAAFRKLRELAEHEALTELSMGMSGDFEIALEEGATHLRIGRAIFGGRA